MSYLSRVGRALLPAVLGLSLVVAGVWYWQVSSVMPAFDPSQYTEEQLLEMELSGKIVRAKADGGAAAPAESEGSAAVAGGGGGAASDEEGPLVWNPAQMKTFPSPHDVWKRVRLEFSDPFHTNGTNDHGIGRLICYTAGRFATGFALAVAVGVLVGTLIGLSPFLFSLLNPYIQVLKPISPLAWMPLLLTGVQDSFLTAILVVFLAALWPIIANTAFGVQGMRKEYLQVARMLELSWPARVFGVILPAAAPAVVAGLRIAFASALIAVVPAEMLLGELGVGYLTWNYWNNGDLSGVIFSVLVIGVLGVLLDLGFQRVARFVSYAE